MEWLAENQTLIAVIVITITLVAILSFISRRRRKKQENDLNNYMNFSDISKTKSSKTKNNDQSPYKFSLETGENLDKIKEDQFLRSTNNISEEEIILRIKKSLANTNLSEDQKKKVIEKYKINLINKSEVKIMTLEEKLKVIENSDLSNDQKAKLTEILKNNSNL